MAYVVAEPCIRCKYTDCVEVCPVDCFHEGANFLVIDPVVCIDCSLCVDECPAGAIYELSDLPVEYEHYAELNAMLAREWAVISARKEPFPDADQWVQVKDKREFLETGHK